MQAIVRFIRREPAMIVSGVLALANIAFNLNEGQTDAVRNLVEAALVLIGGGVVRQNVTPTGGK